MIVLFFSMALMLFIYGVVPFDMDVFWSEQGFGSSLIFTKQDATATIGQSVVLPDKIQGMVSVFAVHEILRRDGVLHYRVSSVEDASGSDINVMAANKFVGSAVFTIPFAGVWVQFLSNTIGKMTFLVLPLLMFLLNSMQSIFRRILPTISTLEKRAVKGRKKVEKDMISDIKDDFVTILKPHSFRQT